MILRAVSEKDPIVTVVEKPFWCARLAKEGIRTVKFKDIYCKGCKYECEKSES